MFKRNSLNGDLDYTIICTHSLVRTIIADHDYDRMSLKLASTLFPIRQNLKNYDLFSEGRIKRKIKLLNTINTKLSKAIQNGSVAGSCYSVALTIYSIGYIANLDPSCIIGLSYTDLRIKGHAWVKVQNKIINPHNININLFPSQSVFLDSQKLQELALRGAYA